MLHRLIIFPNVFSHANPSELPVLRDALKTHRFTLTPKLWTVLESAKPGDASLLPSASALASYDPDNAKWEAVGGKVAQALVTGQSGLSRSLARRPSSSACEAERSVRQHLPGQEPARDANTLWRRISLPTTPATIPSRSPASCWMPTPRHMPPSSPSPSGTR